ncbi:MAG: hypothetical protein NTW28_08840, partial [Candidatus Solibacter sp.]|nr:hypothetical protein [Candidatus Solibacter sp.]
MGDWKIVGSAGTVVAASIPDAPNVLDTGGTLTTVTVTYGLIGNASAFGFSWSISLPEGHADYAHLKKIHVVWVRGSRLVELLTHYHPWSASPLAGEAGVDTRFLQDASAHTTDVVKFLCENDNGTITASPVSKTVTVAASTVSAVSGADASSLATNNPEYHARFKDSATALHTVVNGHVSMSGALYPQTATLWINKQDGNGPQWQGWWRIAEAAQLVQIGLPDSNTDVYPPGGASDGSWLLIAAAGAIPKESSVPASAVISSAFTVPTIPAPSSTWATAAWIDQINYGNNGQVNTWGWKNLFTTLPYDNPDFFFGRWTVQNGSLVDGVFTPGTAGNFAQHDGAEVAFTDDDNGGNGATVLRTPGTNIVTVTNPLMWTLPAYRLGDGSLNPNSCFRFRNYTGSRRDTDG